MKIKTINKICNLEKKIELLKKKILEVQIKKIGDSRNVICCSISGSGPSVFSLVNGYDKAKELKLICDKTYSKNNMKFNSYITGLNSGGVRVI